MRVRTFIALFALLLCGCTTDADKGLCPTAAVLAPTSALTVFRQNAPTDPSGELYSAWMTDVKTGCDFDKDSNVTDSRLHIQIHAKRAPDAQGASYRVPYFVTVTHRGDRIVAKKIFLANITFAPGEASTTFQEDVDSTVIKFERGSRVSDYQILIGFQLTEQQLEYNKLNYRYLP
jgi:hypothetical protein